MAGRHWVGTSGWSYPNWTGPFYPRGCKQGDRLAYYAENLSSVELNAPFYRLPSERTLRGWRTATPAGFVFAVKGWRMITHFKRLGDCAGETALLLDRLASLGDKLGPVLFQLPPRFPADLERLERFLAMLPADRRSAFEFRDPSWHSAEVYSLLARRNAAFCAFELGGVFSPRVVAADFAYVRLHGRGDRYRGNYDEAALVGRADWLRRQMGEGRDVYVYFDNTMEQITRCGMHSGWTSFWPRFMVNFAVSVSIWWSPLPQRQSPTVFSVNQQVAQ